MKQLVFAPILILLFCLTAVAQANNNSCPSIKLVAPPNIIQADDYATFVVEVGEGEAKKDLTYEWTFSRGQIIKGQGTSKIEFATTPEDSGANVTVSVKIVGLLEICNGNVSENFGIASQPIIDPIDDFGKIFLDDRRARLDNFFISLANNPHSEGLVILDLDKKDSRSYKISLVKNICRHSAFRKFDLNRFLFAISEGESERTILWGINSEDKTVKFAGKNYKIIKAEEAEQKIKELFSKK